MTLAERRETLVNSLRASKSWTTGYAEAFVDDYVISTQPAQAVDVTRETAALAWSWYIENREKAMLEGGSKDPLDHMQGALTRVFRAISGEKAGPVDGWREKLQQAIDRARVFDDGSDGADAESARSVVGILSSLLPASPAPDKEGM